MTMCVRSHKKHQLVKHRPCKRHTTREKNPTRTHLDRVEMPFMERPFSRISNEKVLLIEDMSDVWTQVRESTNGTHNPRRVVVRHMRVNIEPTPRSSFVQQSCDKLRKTTFHIFQV